MMQENATYLICVKEEQRGKEKIGFEEVLFCGGGTWLNFPPCLVWADVELVHITSHQRDIKHKLPFRGQIPLCDTHTHRQTSPLVSVILLWSFSVWCQCNNYNIFSKVFPLKQVCYLQIPGHENWSGVKKVRRVREQGKGCFIVYARYANVSSYYEIAQTHTEYPDVS